METQKQEKYTKNQNGFLGQELEKTLIECKSDVTEEEKRLFRSLGLELTLLKHHYTDYSKENIIHIINTIWKEAKNSKIESLKKELTTLEGSQ